MADQKSRGGKKAGAEKQGQGKKHQKSHVMAQTGEKKKSGAGSQRTPGRSTKREGTAGARKP